MTPAAPASRARRMSRGSLPPTRTSAGMPTLSAARRWCSSSVSSALPCSVSMTTRSKPVCPTSSTRAGAGILTITPYVVSPPAIRVARKGLVPVTVVRFHSRGWRSRWLRACVSSAAPRRSAERGEDLGEGVVVADIAGEYHVGQARTRRLRAEAQHGHLAGKHLAKHGGPPHAEAARGDLVRGDPALGDDVAQRQIGRKLADDRADLLGNEPGDGQAAVRVAGRGADSARGDEGGVTALQCAFEVFDDLAPGASVPFGVQHRVDVEF